MQRLARRNLRQSRARTLFSALGVSLGVGMVVAADVISRSIRQAGGQTGYGAKSISQMLGIGLNLVGLVRPWAWTWTCPLC